MSTDIITTNGHAPAQMALADTMTLAETFVRSGFFADARDAAQAVVKILAGRELGFGPMASMTGVYIVKGKVSLSANLMAAAIKRSGRYNYRVTRLDDDGAAITFYEGGQPCGESTFTMAEAKAAGLLSNPTWKNYPRNMLFARALSNGARWYCPDIFGGPLYTPEELGALVDGETGEVLDVPSLPAPVQTRQEPPAATNGHASTPAPSKGKARTQAPATRADTVLPDDDERVVLLVGKIDAITDADAYDTAVAYTHTLDPRIGLHPLVVAALDRARGELDAAAMDWAGPADGDADDDGLDLTGSEAVGEAVAS